MNELLLTLAYKYVATAAMLSEINFFVDRLHLPVQHPITLAEVRNMYIGPPRLLHSLGSMDTAEYSFGFGESGRLRFVTKLAAPYWPSEGTAQQFAPGVINTTAEAYLFATQCLAAISVDVAMLEKSKHPAVKQRFIYGSATTSGPQYRSPPPKVPLSVYDIMWGEPRRPAVLVTVDGATKTLLQIRQNDETFSTRPSGLVKDSERLLRIDDAEFLKYSEVQRKTLISGSLPRDHAGTHTLTRGEAIAKPAHR